jgi:hypothetical protein
MAAGHGVEVPEGIAHFAETAVSVFTIHDLAGVDSEPIMSLDEWI